MKKFKLKTLFFLLPLIVIALLMEIMIRHIPNDYSYKKNYLDENSNSIEVLFLGSSHTYFGVNPQYIQENSFNASHVAQTIDYDYNIIKKYASNWRQLKLIAIPIDYSTLFSSVTNGSQSWRVKNYNIYYDIKLTEIISDNFEILNTKPNLIFKRLYIYYFKNNPEISCSKLGHSSTKKQNDNLEEEGLVAAKRHTHIDKKELKKNTAILKRIIAFGNKHNIQVLLYTTPAYNTYVKNLNQLQLDITNETIQQIIRNEKNCFYYDFLEDSNFIASDYMDSDHLNENGAKKLSTKLNKIINKINND
jgi:hypothetical protein